MSPPFMSTVRRLYLVLALVRVALCHGLVADPAHSTGTESTSPAWIQPSGTGAKLPPWFKQIEALRAKAIPGEKMDEALSGQTPHGTPITPRTPECFPAESRDLFWQMDLVSAGPNAPLRPLNFDLNGDGKIDDAERNAIRGRNTWVLWGGGNEAFWNWLSQEGGYGFTDFLVLMDSRARTNRFVRAGLINQPGFTANGDPANRILGLYLDLAVPDGTTNSHLPSGYASVGHKLTPPPWDQNAHTPQRPANHAGFTLFEPGDKKLYDETMKLLEKRSDGIDYSVYGFPSGIFGLRLFLNPEFFGVGEGPAQARAYWTNRVIETHDRYYTDPSINRDPKLVRPFRVSMSCGYCHVAPNPLNPPVDPEAPDWANLSSNIGDQYWKPQPAFGNLLDANSFFFHFLASQQPGTVDTSAISTDWINNANTINAVFNLNARLGRAALNPTERQSPGNVLVPSIEDAGLPIKGDGTDWRHTPRVLLDGSDSIGAFGALARVYLNIGTFYEQWTTCHNTIIGFTPQRPFSLKVCQNNSVYWQANERYRVPYLAAYFTLKYNGDKGAKDQTNSSTLPSLATHSSTQPMKLASAKESDGVTPNRAAVSSLSLDTPEQRIRGREVWLNNCAICHSSKQPSNFSLAFERKTGGEGWNHQRPTTNGIYTLPMDFADWQAFRASPAFAQYQKAIKQLAAGMGNLEVDPALEEHPFWTENYLSTDIRVPITLVGTSSSRAMASNGLTNNVWDNFSSATYKSLPEVGDIGYFNPISGEFSSYKPRGEGRGYYRPATHASLWATAPFLHNNSLGIYLDDPSVKGRLVQFSDAIRRMLWKDKRASRGLVLSDKEKKWLSELQSKETNAAQIPLDRVVSRLGDLRGGESAAASRDPGYIYRIPQDTSLEFPPAFIQPLIEGVAGKLVTSILSRWLWVFLVVLLASLTWKGKPRYFGITLLGLAVLVAVLLAVSGLGGGGSTIGVLLMGATNLLALSSWQWWVLAVVLTVFGLIFIQARPDSARAARILFGLLLLSVVYVGALIDKSLWITVLSVVIAVGIMFLWKPSLAGFSRSFFLTLTLLTAALGWTADRFVHGRVIVSIPLVNQSVGPLPIKLGPIPRGTPVNLLMSMDPASPKLPKAIVSLILAMAEIKKQGISGEAAYKVFAGTAGQPLLDASNCPDFVLDRGHLFGETLNADPAQNEADKEALIAFLKTL